MFKTSTVSRYICLQSLVEVFHIQGGPKIGTIFVRLNFTKYQPIFKIISLSELGENLY